METIPQEGYKYARMCNAKYMNTFKLMSTLTYMFI